MNANKFKSEIVDKIGGDLGNILQNIINPTNVSKINEIRLRANRPVEIVLNGDLFFISRNGLKDKFQDDVYCLRSDELKDIFLRICRNSIYAYSEEIKNGFITVFGGHRVGICGRMLSDGMIRDISSLNFRIANEIIGCSGQVLPYIVKNELEIRNTLIISPPCCGKTTMIRDIARFLSDGVTAPICFKGADVGIIDERSEIASCVNGIPSNNVGMRTDVLDGCLKEKGIYMMLRSMSPRIIVTDEIGSPGDYRAVAAAINSGVKVVSTTHGSSLDEVRAKNEIGNMIDDNFFERFIILDSSAGPGTVKEIF